MAVDIRVILKLNSKEGGIMWKKCLAYTTVILKIGAGVLPPVVFATLVWALGPAMERLAMRRVEAAGDAARWVTSDYGPADPREEFTGTDEDQNSQPSTNPRAAQFPVNLVRRLVGTPPRVAVDWYRKAAEQGHADAQFNLGCCYDNGSGIPKDPGKAVYWFRKAAKQGHAGAQLLLGACYYNGFGVPKDPKQAVEWFRKAADQGFEPAKAALKELGY